MYKFYLSYERVVLAFPGELKTQVVNDFFKQSPSTKPKDGFL